MDEHGNARLVYQPGPAALARRRGRTRLDPAPASRLPLPLPLLPAGPVCHLPRPVPAPPAAPGHPALRPHLRALPASAPAPGRTRTRRKPVHRTSGRTRGAVTGESAEVHFAADLADGQVPSVRRIKSELHVGQDRARQIHDHLTAVATAPRQPSGRTA